MTTTKPSWAQRLTDSLLVAIVLAVGLMAGAASFNHVHDWTMHNSPTGTAGWFGWANAVITELIPTAALIIIARRRRHNQPIGYPTWLLIVAIGLSLTAQLAVAVPTIFGWMVSALPAVAFFALSKLVFTATKPVPTVDPTPGQVATAEDLHHLATRVHEMETRPTPPVSALSPATAAAAPSPEVTAAATSRPAAKKTPARKPASPRRAPAKKATPAKATSTGTAVSTLEDELPLQVPEPVTNPTAPTRFLSEARIIAQAHHAAHGQPITAPTLANRLNVTPTTAEEILNHLAEVPTTPNTQPHNGAPIEVPT